MKRAPIFNYQKIRISLLGLFCVLGLVLLTGLLITRFLDKKTSGMEAQRLSYHIPMILESMLSDEIWNDLSAPKSLTAFKKFASSHMLRKVENIHKIKIWDPTGKLLWSSDKSQIGERLSGAEKRRVLDGNLVYFIEAPGHNLSERTKFSGSGILETYIPVWRGGRREGRRPDLIVETYTRSPFLLQHMTTERNVIWVIVAVISLSIFLVMLGAILWITHLYENASTQNIRKEVTNTIAKAVGSTLEPEDIFQTIGREIRRAIPFERCVVAMVDRKTNRYTSLFIESDIEIEPRGIEYNELDTWWDKQIYEENRVLNIPDIRKADSSRAKELAEVGFRSMLAAPIIQDDRCVAHISMASTQIGCYTPEHEEHLSEITNHLGPAIRNAMLFRTIKDSETRLTEAQRISHIGSFERNLLTGESRWSDEVYRIFGHNPPQSPLTFGEFIEIVHPDERESISQYLKIFMEKGIPFNTEYRILRRDGEERFVHSRAEIIMDENGRPVQIRGTVQDISERKKAEGEIKASNERYRQVMDKAADAYLLHDLNGRFIDVNQRACKSLGYSREELLSMDVAEIELRTFEVNLHEIWQQMNLESPITIEGLHRRKDGTTFPVEVNLAAIDLLGEKFFLAMARDITKRKQSDDELKRSKEEAEAANKAKSEFLSNMSHELRSPLNSIIGFSDLLLMKSNEEITRQLVPKILNSGKHLTRLVEDVIDFDRIESGEILLDYQKVNLNEIIRNSMELNSARLSSDYKFELCFDSKIDSIMCDPARIRQILTNLHDNAIKYSPSGGVVRVTTQSYPTEIWISVQDEGIGMNPDETEFIFDRFRQLAEGYTRRAGGLGIGLSIVKKLVELHGGRIWVESKSGKGSVFTFSIPHSPRNLETLAAQEDSNGGNTSGGDKDPWAGLTVLVVDDDESIQMYMKALMSSAGKMINAYDGQEGIELASEEIPDLILMDLRMPVMDGLKAIECLKSQPATKGIPIIVVTAQTYQTDKEHCIELGADGYITKPVDIVKFCEEIKNSLALYR